MGTIFVYMDSFDLLTVNISSDVVSSVDHKTVFPFFMQLMCHHCSI